MIAPFGHVLAFAAALFLLGGFCAVARRNLLMIVLGVEVMLNAAGIAFVAGALRWGQAEGQAFMLFTLAVAATEVSVGLAVILYAFVRRRSFDPGAYDLLK
ncbi:MAG: NADH-quinone oxidoreductase subunit NuoK [Deltaproteobacteria bacterium]|nr:NADH-quinone oxidoreductase subunit NuoK [Deltaproteobacteria bacterium]